MGTGPKQQVVPGSPIRPSLEARSAPIAKRATTKVLDGDPPESWYAILQEAFSWRPGHPAEEEVRPFLRAITSGNAQAAQQLDTSDSAVDINRVYLCPANDFLTIVNGKDTTIQEAVLKSVFSPHGAGYRVENNEPEHLEPTKSYNTRFMESWTGEDPSCVVSAIDMKVVQKSVRVNVPSVFTRGSPIDIEQLNWSCSGSASSKHQSIDLHNDFADKVFTVCTGPKLWLFYPPTQSNLEVFYSSSNQRKRLARTCDKLEHGVYAIVNSGEAVYLPPGWLHATYALRKSMIVGVQWSSSEALETATALTIHELQCGDITEQPQLRPFFRCLLLALQQDRKDTCRVALQAICAKKIGRKFANLTKVTGEQAETRQILAEINKFANKKHFKDWRCEEEACASRLFVHLRL